jgi:C-methyltransferase
MNAKQDTQERLARLMTGHWVAQMLAVVARLGIADLLKDGPKSSQALAEQVGVNPEALFRVMRALVTADVFSQPDPGVFALTPVGRHLRSDVYGSIRWNAAMYCDVAHWAPWSYAMDAVVTGEPVAQKALGSSVWSYLCTNAPQMELFHKAMSDTAEQNAVAMLEAYDFNCFPKIVDIGGGRGNLLETILDDCPETRGVLFDLPEVVEAAKERYADSASLPRMEFLSGNFVETIPSGGDAYLMKNVLHDWSDVVAIKIMRNIRAAIKPGGTLLVAEQIVTDENAYFSAWMDLNMMIVHGGKERTAEEFQHIFEACGFELTNIIPTRTQNFLIEGKPKSLRNNG